MNKRAATPLSILLLVFMTLILVATSLFVFYISGGNIKEKVSDLRFIDDVYVKEEQINFYIAKMVETSFKQTKTEKEFIEKLREEIEKLKEYEEYDEYPSLPEPSKIEFEISEENLDYSDDLVKINFKIEIRNKITEGIGNNEKEIIRASYNYNKIFEADLKEKEISKDL